MNFDYYTLKKMAKEGSRVGNWNGRPVFACSVNDLENKGTGAFYILYDDENKIIGKDGKFYYSYGTVDKNGTVNEYSSRRRYNMVCETQHDHGDYKVNTVMKSATMPQSPAAVAEVSYTSGPVPDVRVEIDVEATLKRAREMTIDDLLEGFMVDIG